MSSTVYAEFNKYSKMLAILDFILSILSNDFMNFNLI